MRKRSLIFLYHRPEMLRNFCRGMILSCLVSLHCSASRFVFKIKKPCDFGCLFRLVLRTDFDPNYLIFRRFYLKNRTTIKPTSKPLFNDFNARRGIATYNCNFMVNDGNSSILSTKERTFRATLFMPNSTQRRITPRQCGEHMFASFYFIAAVLVCQ